MTQRYTRDKDALSNLLSEITNHGWNKSRHLGWLSTFLILLTDLAPRARQKDDDGDNAMSRIAWDLGQLVDDPNYTRNNDCSAEEVKQNARDTAAINAFAKRALVSYGIDSDRLWEALTYCQSDDNLFSGEHEDRWFTWARENFFPLSQTAQTEPV